MNLNDDEKSMLHGQQGAAIQKAMEFLVNIGDACGAEEMVDVSHAHIMSVETTDILYELLSEFTEGAKFKIATTTHSLPFDFERVKDMKLPESAVEKVKDGVLRIKQLHKSLGAIPAYTCLPYFLHHLTLGQHIAFTDSLVVPLVNSWFGVRTNMESPLSAIASAITGKTPKCGMHLPENRLGRVLIEIATELEAENFDYADYGALSYWAGKIRIDGIPAIPVYKGLSPKFALDEAKYMSLSHTWNSGMTMFHVAGVTPEATTVEAAFGGKRPEARFLFGKREMKETYQELTSSTEERVDVVCFGCPHCTIQELANIAKLLSGRKVHHDTQLWVATNQATKNIAERMGIIDVIEGAGGVVISDACVVTPTIGLESHVVATATVSHCLFPVGRTVWFGKTLDCINAAIEGKWEAR